MSDATVNTRLLELIRDAAQHVPLYRQRWQAAGIGVAQSRGGVDLQQIPLLDKAALRACPPSDRMHERRRNCSVSTESSSGSSGEPLSVSSDRRAWFARRGAFLRALLACGYLPGQRCLLLSSRRNSRWPALARWTYASIAEDTEALARRVGTIQPRLLYGPLSTLEQIAHCFVARREPAPTPALVVSTAEQLTHQRRNVLERGFGAPVADFYGMTEFGLIAWRRAGEPAFVPARASLILEFLPVSGDAAIERLVITDLAERSAPLIRYETGDSVRRDHTRAGCPIVEFAGRSIDCLLLADGRLVSPYRIDVELEQIPGLCAFEVVQGADRSVDVTLDAAAADAARIVSIVRQKLEVVLGPGLRLRIATGTIRRGAPGTKFRPIRSLAAREA